MREKVAREAGRMRGRSAVDLKRWCADRYQDPLDNQPVAILNVMVREAEHTKALGCEPGVANCIPFGVVERPVGLDYQPIPQANEVKHIGADRDLSPEFEPLKASVAQAFPEELLR